jgi:hypothetical protein
MDFWRLLTGRMREDELVAIQESEDVPHAGSPQ